VYKSFEVKEYLVKARMRYCYNYCYVFSSAWPLHDVAITNIVSCMAYGGEVGGGVVNSPIAVN